MLTFFEKMLVPEHDYSFPKYDSYLDENDGLLKIDVALAGYSKKDLEVLYSNQQLMIRTVENYESPTSSTLSKTRFLQNNLARRKFKLIFDILKPYKVVSCTFRDGLLNISMELPEAFNENSQIEILD